MPKRSGSTDKDGEDGDDEEGMMKSVEYICGLIDLEIESGVPADRIIVGGFSQGCAIALLVGLLSRYQGRLGGVMGLSGYLPLQKKTSKIMGARNEEMKASSTTKWFLAHGSRDQLVPKRLFMSYVEQMKLWEGGVEDRVYEGMGHEGWGVEVGDLCGWLEGRLGDG